MSYGGTVLAAVTRMKENRAMQKSGNKFRSDKKDLYFKHPDKHTSPSEKITEKILTNEERTALRQKLRTEVIKRRITDAVFVVVGIILLVLILT